MAYGDWNSHIGQSADGIEGVHGELPYGEINIESETLLEFASPFYIAVTNSFLHKCKSHLDSFHSGKNQSQSDYMLL